MISEMMVALRRSQGVAGLEFKPRDPPTDEQADRDEQLTTQEEE